MDEMYNDYDNADINANEMNLEDDVMHSGESSDDFLNPEEQKIQGTDSEETSSCPSSDEDPLASPMKEFEELQKRAEDIEREGNDDRNKSHNAKKLCATRHGCQGATDCNYSYGSYPG